MCFPSPFGSSICNICMCFTVIIIIFHLNSCKRYIFPLYLKRNTFSLSDERDQVNKEMKRPPAHMRWPHAKAHQVHGLSLREIGGGFTRHHRAPSIRAASYAIAKPLTMFQKMKNTTRLRGHRNAVYCGMCSHKSEFRTII